MINFFYEKDVERCFSVPDAKSVLRSSRILWFYFILQKLGAGFSYAILLMDWKKVYFS